MDNTLKNICLGLLLMGAASCTSHYELVAVDRSRIVIDKRFDAHPDAEAAAFLEPYKAKVDEVMAPVVGEVAHDMAAYRPESDLSNLLPDILMWAASKYDEQPDFAVQNIGGIRAALSKGVVTYGDVLDVAPFDNKICFITLTGDKVLELFRQIAVRGGEGLSHGVRLVIGSDGQLRSVQLHGKDIDPQASYRVATIDYLAQGNDQLTAFKAGTNLHAPAADNNNIRFVIMDYFRAMQAQGKEVDARVEGRVVVEK
jgi:2',3'-cyclic-nucleotide 2'-phosphodiesterase (5'-nucleotidase family)